MIVIGDEILDGSIEEINMKLTAQLLSKAEHSI